MALIFFSLFIHKIHSLYIITAIIFTVIITIILIIIIMANEKSSKKRAVKVLHFSNGHSLSLSRKSGPLFLGSNNANDWSLELVLLLFVFAFNCAFFSLELDKKLGRKLRNFFLNGRQCFEWAANLWPPFFVRSYKTFLSLFLPFAKLTNKRTKREQPKEKGSFFWVRYCYQTKIISLNAR